MGTGPNSGYDREMESHSRSLKAHLTYANVMATVAVFIALGGSSYAAVKLNGKDIKKNTVAGKALKKDTLTGREIKESKLGKVPAAASADSATAAASAGIAALADRATTADSVGGATVTPINKTATPGATPVLTDLYTRGGMKLTGACSTANDFPTITANSSATGGSMSSYALTLANEDVGRLVSTSIDSGESVPLTQGPFVLTFGAQYQVTLRNADGSAATVMLNATKNTLEDGLKCRYIGVGFGV